MEGDKMNFSNVLNLVNGELKSIDVGKANDYYFLNEIRSKSSNVKIL